MLVRVESFHAGQHGDLRSFAIAASRRSAFPTTFS